MGEGPAVGATSAGCTGPTALEVTTLPSYPSASRTARSVSIRPTSAPTGSYDAAVAPGIGTPSASHWSERCAVAGEVLMLLTTVLPTRAPPLADTKTLPTTGQVTGPTAADRRRTDRRPSALASTSDHDHRAPVVRCTR